MNDDSVPYLSSRKCDLLLETIQKVVGRSLAQPLGNAGSIMLKSVLENARNQLRYVRLPDTEEAFQLYQNEITQKLVWAYESPQTDVGLIASQAIGAPVTQASLSKDPNSRRKMTDVTAALREVISAMKRRSSYNCNVFFKKPMDFFETLEVAKQMTSLSLANLMRYDSPQLIHVTENNPSSPFWQQLQYAAHRDQMPTPPYYKWRITFRDDLLVYYSVTMLEIARKVNEMATQTLRASSNNESTGEKLLLIVSPQRECTLEIIPSTACQQVGSKDMSLRYLEIVRQIFPMHFRGVPFVQEMTVQEMSIFDFIFAERLLVEATIVEVAFKLQTGYAVVMPEKSVATWLNQHSLANMAIYHRGNLTKEATYATWNKVDNWVPGAIYASVPKGTNVEDYLPSSEWYAWQKSHAAVYVHVLPKTFTENVVSYAIQGNPHFQDVKEVVENVLRGRLGPIRYPLNQIVYGNIWFIDWAQVSAHKYGPNLFGRFLDVVSRYGYQTFGRHWQQAFTKRRPVIATILQTATEKDYGPVQCLYAPKNFLSARYNHQKEAWLTASQAGENHAFSEERFTLLKDTRVVYAIARHRLSEKALQHFWTFPTIRPNLLSLDYVDQYRTYSSNFEERAKLGIAASCLLIIMEFTDLLVDIKPPVSRRHVMLMGDVMTQTGHVLSLQSPIPRGASWHAVSTQANGYRSLKQRAIFRSTSYACSKGPNGTTVQGPHNNTAAYLGTLIVSGTGLDIEVRRVGYDLEHDMPLEDVSRKEILASLRNINPNISLHSAARQTQSIATDEPMIVEANVDVQIESHPLKEDIPAELLQPRLDPNYHPLRIVLCDVSNQISPIPQPTRQVTSAVAQLVYAKPALGIPAPPGSSRSSISSSWFTRAAPTTLTPSPTPPKNQETSPDNTDMAIDFAAANSLKAVP